MARRKREEGAAAPEASAVELYEASARDALTTAAGALHQLASGAVDAREMTFAGKAFIAEKMVRDITRTFGAETAKTEPPPAPSERKPRKPRQKKQASLPAMAEEMGREAADDEAPVSGEAVLTG
jgi:hypothetical protein